MGLDMYLSRATSTKYWEHKGEENRFEITIKKGGKEYKTLPIRSIVEEIGYWRKANQIHNWFVKNVQNGEDDCKSYEFTLETLLKLREVCKEVLGNKTKAVEMLPTSAGFFFGGKEYDEYYFGALQETVEMIDKAEASHQKGTYFTYQASW